MRVGLSLLTLVPGEVGGAETSARGLARGLADVGTLDYVAFTPPAAPGAGEGLPETPVPEYRNARSVRERLLAMTLATIRPARLRGHYAGLDAVHYPLTIAVPTLDLPTRRDRSRPPAPRPPRALLAGRAALAGADARALRPQCGCGDRAEPVRPPPRDRAAGPAARARPCDPVGRRPRALPPRRARSASRSSSTRPGRGRTRTTPASSRRSRSLREERPGAAARAHGRRPRGTARPAGRRGTRPRSRARSSPRSTGAPPASSSRASTRASASRRSRRWRRARPLRRRTSRRSPRSRGRRPRSSIPRTSEDIAAVVSGVLDAPDRFAAAGPPSRRERFTWAETARRHEAVYAGLT